MDKNFHSVAVYRPRVTSSGRKCKTSFIQDIISFTLLFVGERERERVSLTDLDWSLSNWQLVVYVDAIIFNMKYDDAWLQRKKKSLPSANSSAFCRICCYLFVYLFSCYSWYCNIFDLIIFIFIFIFSIERNRHFVTLIVSPKTSTILIPKVCTLCTTIFYIEVILYEFQVTSFLIIFQYSYLLYSMIKLRVMLLVLTKLKLAYTAYICGVQTGPAQYRFGSVSSLVDEIICVWEPQRAGQFGQIGHHQLPTMAIIQ